MKRIVSLAVLTTLLAACGNLGTSGNVGNGYGPLGEESLDTTANVADNSLNDTYLLAAAPKYYIGSPYKVEDVQYTPIEDLNYNQTGIAGIIPAELNGSKTSNGETFDINQMVATSKTLPLPTIAKVTNLSNGNSITVRINNRGPFVNTRIMDLSPAAAAKIGVTSQSKVQVQILADQSTTVKNATLGTTTATAEESNSVAPAPVVSGDYAVQVGAFYAEDSATSLVQKMKTYGDAVVSQESGMYKVRIINLDAAKARSVIDTLRTSEGMTPGLLKDGKWINADSI